MQRKYKVIAVLFVAVALYVVRYPNVLLGVPWVGWLLYMMITGHMAMMDPIGSGIFQRCADPAACPWLSPGDVIADVCSKCGTNWMMTILHELRTWKNPELNDFRDLNDVVPWPESKLFPEDEDVEHRHEHWGNDWNKTGFLFKEFKSHLPVYVRQSGDKLKVIPVDERKDLKFIVMFRNPTDQLVSMSHFMKTFTPEMRQFWGDMPEFDVSYETMVGMVFNGGDDQNPFWFFKAWREYKDRSNVLQLHYSDVFKEPLRYIKRIAEFLELKDIPEEVFLRIAEVTSVKSMKKREHKYQCFIGKNRDIPSIKIGGYIRKGGTDGKQELSQELRKKIHLMALEALSVEEVRILEHGFDN